MAAPLLLIARYTVKEALRGRFLWLCLLLVCAALGLSALLGQLALTESRATEAVLVAAALRLAAVFLLMAFVVTSMAREAADKGLELVLALPLPRAAYLLGKLAGFAALAALPAALFGCLTLLWAAPLQSLLWALSLLAELWIVAAFALLCAASLQHALPALAASGGFYLLARMIDSLQLLAHGGHGAGGALQGALAAGIDLLALLLPRLDLFARGEWLLYATGNWTALAALGAQTAIYVALLTAAALCDFYRRSVP